MPKDKVFWHRYLGENEQEAIKILNESVSNAGITDGKPTYEFYLTSRPKKLEEKSGGLTTQFKGL